MIVIYIIIFIIVIYYISNKCYLKYESTKHINNTDRIIDNIKKKVN